MCDPVTLTVAATALSVASTATSTISAVHQARYEAKVADYNKGLENQKGKDEQLRANIEVRDAARRQAQLMGAQRAAMAANGIDLSFGNAADLMSDTALAASEERTNIRENSRRAIMGFDLNAANYGSQAIAARSRATGALIGGGLQIASTLAGGAQKFGKIQADRKNGGTGWGGV